MFKYDTTPYAILTLRLTMGLLFLIHMGEKLFVFTPSGTAKYFAGLGLPGELAYVVIVWELVGGAALLLGIWARPIALVMVADLLGTIINVHGPAGFFFNNPNGGWEFPALWIVGLLVIVFSQKEVWAIKPFRLKNKSE